MWDISCSTRDQILAPPVLEGEVLTTGSSGKFQKWILMTLMNGYFFFKSGMLYYSKGKLLALITAKMVVCPISHYFLLEQPCFFLEDGSIPFLLRGWVVSAWGSSTSSSGKAAKDMATFLLQLWHLISPITPWVGSWGITPWVGSWGISHPFSETSESQRGSERSST